MLAFGLIFAGAFFVQPSVGATVGLKVAPLEYKSVLRQGETKKGFIDISNPTDQKLVVHTNAQAFRQVDNEGTLQFYDDEQVKAGVRLDLDDFELGPREAIRMYFLLDSSKLPSGDVFAGIFFTTEPAKTAQGVGQTVKLGTLLSIVNGAPGEHKAEISALNTPSFLIGDTITGSYRIKNTGDPTRSTGFYPTVSVGVSPFGERQIHTGKLVFAGRSRENSFAIKAPLIGIYQIKVGYANSIRSKWIFIAQPIAIIVIAVVVVAVMFYRSLRGRRRAANVFRIK